jgi:hypothetical protein
VIDCRWDPVIRQTGTTDDAIDHLTMAKRVPGEMLDEVAGLLRDSVRITEVGKTILLRVQRHLAKNRGELSGPRVFVVDAAPVVLASRIEAPCARNMREGAT